MRASDRREREEGGVEEEGEGGMGWGGPNGGITNGGVEIDGGIEGGITNGGIEGSSMARNKHLVFIVSARCVNQRRCCPFHYPV